MNDIKMVDLKGQYLKIQEEIDSAIKSVIDSTSFVKGPEVKKFEEELADYLNVKHVISCANGTDAIQVALMALELEPGDEIITPDFTFIATVEAIVVAGLKPVLIDVDRDSFNLSTKSLEEAITPKTKAILPVHLFGQCANMEEIVEIANKHNLKIIEDTAQAIGTNYFFSNGEVQKAGTIGDLGTTSFFPSKNLGCYGDGGAIFTNDDDLAHLCRSIVNHGMEIRYHHDRIGVNSRLDSIQAAILRVKLKYLDEYSASRIEASKLYNKYLRDLQNIKTPYKVSYSEHIFHQYTILVEDRRNELKDYLAEKEIPSMIYYPIPIHQQKAFDDFHHSGAYQNSVYLSQKVLSLPMHTELREEQIVYITDKIRDFVNGEM